MRRSNSKTYHSKSPVRRVSLTPKAFKQNENHHPSLGKAHKLLASHAQMLLDQNMNSQAKASLCKGIKKLSQCLEKLDKSLTSLERANKQLNMENQDLRSDLREEKIKTSRFSEKLTWISTQTNLMKERIEDSDNKSKSKNNADLMKILEDKEYKICSLINEKEDMKAHVRDLEERLRKQEAVLTQMNGLTSFENSPTKDSIDSDVCLQRQIENLDYEIGLLQKSLQKALDK